MGGRIPQTFIDDLVQRTDIVEVIGSRVPLTRAGREYKACCPFHGEKTPSFTVSPTKGFYHCFGCGAHGTALGFLMEYERLEFPAAVEVLARAAGIEMPQTEADGPRLAPLYELLEHAAGIYREALAAHPAATRYLAQRGLGVEVVRDFGIGYAPPGWDTVLTRLGRTETDRAQLLAAGLVIEREGGGHYDRFRDRIMFPIRDVRGRVVGFGGRVTGKGEPKYLNSPETPVFHKGRELYGLHEVRRARVQPDRIIVVEGYMDVAGLAGAGVHNAVATLGTATTDEHLRRLFGTAGEVVFCFDGDRAGRDAAWKALQGCLPGLREGRQVRFLLLPDGEDPDSYVRQYGAEAFGQQVTDSQPLSAFLLGTLEKDADLGTADGKARLAALAAPLLGRIPDPVYRMLLIDELGRRIGLPPARLESLMGGGTPAPPAEPPRRPATAAGSRQPATGRGSLARQAIGLLLHFPVLATRIPIPRGVRDSDQRGVPLLCEIHAIAQQRPDTCTAALLERFRGRPELPHLEQLVASDPLVGLDGAEREFTDCMDRLLDSAAQQQHAALLAKGIENLDPAERVELARLQKMRLDADRRLPGGVKGG